MTHQTQNTVTLIGGHMETFLTLNITIHKIIQQVTCSLIFIYKKKCTYQPINNVIKLNISFKNNIQNSILNTRDH